MYRLNPFSFTSLFILLFTIEVLPQGWTSQSLNTTEYPQSVRNLGMGMNGVVSSSSIDALTYNPSNLLFTKEPVLSFYHQGLQLVVGNVPMNDYSVNFNINSIGSFGIDYEDWNLGEFGYSTLESPIPVNIDASYERSIAIGYAKKLNGSFGIGGSFRYCFASYAGISSSKAYLLSLGINDKFEFINRSWQLGFSIMNLGPAVSFTYPDNQYQYGTPPSFLALGLNVKAIETEFLSVPVSLSIAKPFDERTDNYEGQSSFKTLFTDWKDFPNDASLSPGLAFEWKPINMGNGFYFNQNIFLGNYSSGIKSGLTDYYTFGSELSIGYKGINITAGIAGVWHNAQYENYFPWRFPYETFQFSLSANPNTFSNSLVSSSYNNSSSAKNIILTIGANQLLRVGNASSISIQGITLEQNNNLEYSVEAAYYLNDRTALVTSFSYNSIPFKINYQSLGFTLLDTKFETLTFSSSFRYHPFENIKDLFIQSGLGIVRTNPVLSTSPRYYYSPAVLLSAGYNFKLSNGIVLVPVLGYNLTLMDSWENRANISGNNQFNLGIKIGYEF